MKKFVLFVFVLISAKAFSQEKKGFIGNIMSRTSFGLKAGGNYSNFTNAGFETEGLAGFHVGGIINFKLSDRFSIQEDILYSTQGAKIKDKTLFSGDEIKLSYMSIPILLRYQTSLGVYVEAGPQANMLITDAKNTGFEKFADKIDAGAAFGLGFQFKEGPVQGLGFGVRYYMGLTDVGQFNSSSIKSDFRNNVAQASIFYVFTKKK
ncbi:Outer membrane protein beta-barrel domain-containing protein [Chitinophaga sp. CF118]|uniref:porin family protein n=1 Tax=Chitinophaga sp. CF118 TaxID=1884367 RepID=UPI0008E3D288|nr:porin family protein [Chitinophaga sp. CF118]SFD87299.1 Outer membrane protein beta-barrel domain-containing protein [Chitinophaga sp. CF118]